jgi:hypothetical protein
MKEGKITSIEVRKERTASVDIEAAERWKYFNFHSMKLKATRS